MICFSNRCESDLLYQSGRSCSTLSIRDRDKERITERRTSDKKRSHPLQFVCAVGKRVIAVSDSMKLLFSGDIVTLLTTVL